MSGKPLVLGIDPSTNCTGYSLIDSNTMKIITYGTIPNKNKTEANKILNTYNTLNEILKTYDITQVAIEEAFYSRNVKTLKSLSQIHGVILLLIAEYNIPYVYYSVMTIKSTTLGKIKAKKEDGKKKTGNEMKAEVAAKIIEVFGQDQFGSDLNFDITDATSVGYTFLKKSQQGVK